MSPSGTPVPAGRQEGGALLVERLRAARGDERLRLIPLVAAVPGKTTRDALVAALRDEDRRVVTAAVRAVGELELLEAAEPLIDLLESGGRWERFHVVEALGRIGDLRATRPLMRAGEEPALGPAVLRALGRLGDLRALDYVVDRLVDDGGALRPAAAGAVASLYRGRGPRRLGARHRGAVADAAAGVLRGRLDTVLDALQGASESETRDGLLLLVLTGEDGGLREVVRALADSRLRPAAAEMLAEAGPGTARAVSASLRVEEAPETVTAKLAILDAVGEPPDARTLVPILAHADPGCRALALELLRAAPADIVDAALPLVSDPEAEVREAAVACLLSWAGAADPGRRARLAAPLALLRDHDEEGIRAAAFAGLVALGGPEDPAENVRAGLEDRSPCVRRRTVQALGGLPGEPRDGWVLAALSDPDHGVRERAALLAESSSSPDVTLALERALEDADLWVRAAAARALGRRRRPEDIPRLERLLDAREPPVRAAAVEGLGHIGGDVVWSVLSRQIEHHDPEMRKVALRALARSGAPEAVGWIRRALEDDDWSVRYRAADALGVLGDRRAVQPLLALLDRDRDHDVRAAALRALAYLDTARALPALVPLLREPALADTVAEVLLTHGRRHVAYLKAEAACHPDGRAREQLADIVARIGGR